MLLWNLTTPLPLRLSKAEGWSLYKSLHQLWERVTRGLILPFPMPLTLHQCFLLHAVISLLSQRFRTKLLIKANRHIFNRMGEFLFIWSSPSPRDYTIPIPLFCCCCCCCWCQHFWNWFQAVKKLCPLLSKIFLPAFWQRLSSIGGKGVHEFKVTVYEFYNIKYIK